MNDPNRAKATFQFSGYTFEKLSFAMENEYDPTQKYQVDFNLTIDTQLVDKTCKNEGFVILECNIKSDHAFSIHAIMKGKFILVKSTEDIDFEKFLKCNGTAVMYPYLRAAISELTKTCNIQPLTLPLINVTHFLKEEDKEKIIK